MRFSDIKKGKKYLKVKADNHGGVRGRLREKREFILLVVDKDEDKNEICASVVPEVGTPTAPVWYKKEQFARWKPIN